MPRREDLTDPSVVSGVLARAGFVAAGEEADELLTAAGGDAALLARMLERRLGGEPLAWITGHATFCGIPLRVHEGVYVPRPQTELLAQRAVELLPAAGVAVDVCTGSGAIAVVLMRHRPGARVVATDLDDRAVACARANGVAALRGDLLEPVPGDLRGTVDLVVGVVPYVPTPDLPLLQRDTLTFESPLAYDGGDDGAQALRRTVRESAGLLRPGGALLLEARWRSGRPPHARPRPGRLRCRDRAVRRGRGRARAPREARVKRLVRRYLLPCVEPTLSSAAEDGRGLPADSGSRAGAGRARAAQRPRRARARAAARRPTACPSRSPPRRR